MTVIQLTKEELINAVYEGVKKAMESAKTEKKAREYMNTTEAANYLGIAMQTMYEKTMNKVIPHVKRGKKLYFSKVELDDYLQGGRVVA